MRRAFSSEAAVAKPARSGAGLVQRVSSFLVGAGLMALITQFSIIQELQNANKVMLDKHADLERRVATLENKKK
jgi:hypothetical protein